MVKDFELDDMIPVATGTDLSTSEGREFKKEPAINVIRKEDFEERVSKVFHLLWKSLARSFGPYGAPTLIYNYPWSHATKDGYTIAKNLSFDASETIVDQAIADMAINICGRLNYSVGDGTTTAIISTNSIYQNYMYKKAFFEDRYILPRDIIKKFNEIKADVINELNTKVRPIRTENMEELRKNIYEVAYVSSNADEKMSTYIADLYKEIGSPGIIGTLSPDGRTNSRCITGYKFNLLLTDRLYINNDDQTMSLTNTDIVIFGIKVTESTYKKLIKPLNIECKARGRHLVICAPSYDETALKQIIVPELNEEYNREKKVSMVLTVYRNITPQTKLLANDFSVLMNTLIIDKELESKLIAEVDSGIQISQIFNIDKRELKGTKHLAVEESTGRMVLYTYGVDDLPEGIKPLYETYEMAETNIPLGFVGECQIGLKEGTSRFDKLIYNEEKYKKLLSDAENDLRDTVKKYEKLGTFNTDVSHAQERLYSLKMKMGVIEVGGDSELSIKLLKDSVDDSIRAAESAFNHGVVLGCNVNLIQILFDRYDKAENEIDKALLEILMSGFMDVYKTVLRNAFDNAKFHRDTIEGAEELVLKMEDYFKNKKRHENDVFENFEAFERAFELLKDHEYITYHDIIVAYSLITNTVFDVSTLKFTDTIVNSKKTDEEILKATIDLITLLIVGNQMVVTQKHNF